MTYFPSHLGEASRYLELYGNVRGLWLWRLELLQFWHFFIQDILHIRTYTSTRDIVHENYINIRRRKLKKKAK